MNWDFRSDMERWHAIAVEAHQRHSRPNVLPYVRSQNIVEAPAHRHVANAAMNARRVLEIGVGGGEHLVFVPLADMRRYVGIDIELAFAGICRDRFGIPVAAANVAQMPFRDHSFDCVIAMSVLEHIQPLDQALAEIHRVLEPGGQLQVVIPTNGSPLINLYKLLMTYPTMRKAGIQRPDLVWHYLNINSFKRVRAVLARWFRIENEIALPAKFLPWHLSPLWGFSCLKD